MRVGEPAPELKAEEIHAAWVAAYERLPEEWIANPSQRYRLIDYQSERMAEWMAGLAEEWPLDLNQTAIAMQAALERGMVTHLDMSVFRLAAHFVGVGICTMSGRQLQ